MDFKGYTIPKDTQVLVNLNSVLRSPEVWGDPDKFRPERFIGEDGKLLRFEELIPFSIGLLHCYYFLIIASHSNLTRICHHYIRELAYIFSVVATSMTTGKMLKDL